MPFFRLPCRRASVGFKAPLSMSGRIYCELSRHGLAGNNRLPDGISLHPAPLPPPTTLAELLFRLRQTPPHLAGHTPHSPLTRAHILSVSSPDLAERIRPLFKNWPRLKITGPGEL